jgi:LmbE family N-acetylglucosaminyl deacetylase
VLEQRLAAHPLMVLASFQLSEGLFTIKGDIVKVRRKKIYLWVMLLTVGTAAPVRAEIALAPDDRILVLSPHPDDDILGCAGLIQEAVRRHLPVRVVFLTNGDNYEWAFLAYKKRPVLSPEAMRQMGLLRRDEAVAAEHILGVPAENLFFLGYPDWGTEKIWTEHWGEDQPAFRSMLTRTREVPYANAYRPGAAYRGEEIVSDIKALMLDFKPTKVFVSHPADGHRDHRSFYLFSQIALWELEGQMHPEVYPFLIHYRQWPMPRGFQADRTLTPPDYFHSLQWTEHRLTLPQIEGKRLALADHRTQMVKDHAYLLSFVATNELFGNFPPIELRSVAASSHTVEPPVTSPVPASQEESIDAAIQHLSRDKDRLTLRVLFSKPLARLHRRTNVYVFGFRGDTPFAAMPKIRVSIGLGGIRVFDQQRELLDHGVTQAWNGNVLTLSVPLLLIGNPERILGSAYARSAEEPLDWQAWRVIELGKSS